MTSILDDFRLDGRRALVTGSSRGLGLVLARGLAEAGAAVVLNGRNPETLDAAAEELRADGHTVSTCVFDVTDANAVADALRAFTAEHGGIDILVNNAGIQQRAPLAEMEAAAWDAVVANNLSSAFYVARAVVPEMIARGQGGKVINVCSLMSEVGRPSTGNYAAAKGGLKMLTRAMAVEWAAHDIQINAIGPGYFATEMTKPLRDNPEFDGWLKKRTPAGRWGDPRELVGAVVYFASPASSFVNGQILYIDGGVLASL